MSKRLVGLGVILVLLTIVIIQPVAAFDPITGTSDNWLITIDNVYSALSLPNGAMELRRSLLHDHSIAKEKAAFPLSLLPRECYSNIMACGFLTGGD